MKSFRHRLPPLDGLVVFEAVVRCGGLTRAAEELKVSQAAVSKRIKGLEENLGTKLLHRVGRRVSPTEAGQKLNDRVALALDYIDEACTTARTRQETNSVSISANTAVSHFWLRPRLSRFGQSHPAVSLRMVTSDLTADLLADDNDLAIVYGTYDRPGWKLVPLFGQQLIPVASPAYIDANDLQGKSDRWILDNAILLDHVRKEPNWTNWHVWLSDTGFISKDFWAAQTFNSYALAIESAMDGQGIVLASLPMLNDLLNRDILRPVTTSRLECQDGYSLAYSTKRPLAGTVKGLFEWLLESPITDVEEH